MFRIIQIAGALALLLSLTGFEQVSAQEKAQTLEKF